MAVILHTLRDAPKGEVAAMSLVGATVDELDSAIGDIAVRLSAAARYRRTAVQVADIDHITLEHPETREQTVAPSGAVMCRLEDIEDLFEEIPQAPAGDESMLAYKYIGRQ